MNNSSICRAITAADILRLEVAKTKTKSNPQPLGLKLVIDLLLYSSLIPRDSSRIQYKVAHIPFQPSETTPGAKMNLHRERDHIQQLYVPYSLVSISKK